MVTVTIRLKKHVAHYVKEHYGNPVKLPRKLQVRYNFLSCIQKEFEPASHNRVKLLSTTIEVHLNEKDLRQHGASVKPGMMFYINNLFEEQLRNEMFFTVNRLHYVEGNSITGAIKAWMQQNGFDEETFPFATIHQAYYTMRKSLIKNRNNSHKAA